MPQLFQSPEAAVLAQDRQPSLAHRLALSVLRLVLICAVAGLIGGGYYLARKGFGRQWRSRVVEELHQRGVEASVRRLTLDPFRGLIARDVRIFDYKDKRHENALAVVSEISLDINYAAFIHRQPFLNALDVRNAQIRMPLKGPDGKVVSAQLKNFRAHVYFPPEQIYVSQAEGIFCGIRISATGQLIKRENYQPSPQTSPDWQSKMWILQRIVAELEKFAFTVPPALQVKFSGDLAELENARLEATLRGDGIRRGNYQIGNFSAAAEWADQRLDLTHCEWTDARGNFAGRASWSRQTNAADFQLRSTLDLSQLFEAFGLGDWLAGTQFYAPPLVEVSGSANLEQDRPELKVIGRLAASRFAYKSVPFSNLSANFSWDGDRTFVRDIHLGHESGQLTAELFDGPNDFRLNIDSTITPSAFRPLASPEINQFLREWEWQRPPAVHLAIYGQDRHPANWRGEGTITLNRTRFRGVWANSGSAKIQFGDGAVIYDNIRVVRDEGIGTGSFTYDFKNHEVRIANIKTALRPTEVIFWIDPDLWKTIVPYKFHQVPNLTVNGVYQFAGGKKTHLDITVDAPHGMDYIFLGKTLPFDRVAARLLFTNDRLELADLKGGLFGGTVRGNADISLLHNDPHYQANIAVKAIDFPRLTDLYYQYKTSHGQLNGSYEFTGLGSDPRKMRGNGKIQVTNGDVFAIPVFGPLSGILNSIVPGTGYSIAHKATATFAIKDGTIHTDDFDVAGKLFGMLGHGDIYFLDDKLDFQVRLNMHGAAGVLLTPVYKLFEYAGEGSLKKPDWHPKRF